MTQALFQRLLSLSLASVFTFAIVASVSELFVGAETQQTTLAQHSASAKPRG